MLCKETLTLTDRNIPVLLCYPEGAQALPLVLINHGTSGNKEGMLWIGEQLAQRGCFSVCIDAVWHGERKDGNYDIMLQTPTYKQYYLRMLLQMADDMSALIDCFTGDSRVDTGRVGMTGISQGGYVAFMTMSRDPRITAAAPMIGSPDLTDQYGNSPAWETIAPQTQQAVLENMPLNHAEKLLHVKLLVQNSIEDTVVPVTGTRRLDEKLRAAGMQDYQYIEYPGIGHETPPQMLDRAIDWLAEKL